MSGRIARQWREAQDALAKKASCNCSGYGVREDDDGVLIVSPHDADCAELVSVGYGRCHSCGYRLNKRKRVGPFLLSACMRGHKYQWKRLGKAA